MVAFFKIDHPFQTSTFHFDLHGKSFHKRIKNKTKQKTISKFSLNSFLNYLHVSKSRNVENKIFFLLFISLVNIVGVQQMFSEYIFFGYSVKGFVYLLLICFKYHFYHHGLKIYNPNRGEKGSDFGSRFS